MPEDKRPEEEQDKEPFVPSSPVKRALAWIGLVYMVLLLGLSACFYFTGKMLTGLAPLLLVPGLTGLGAVALVSWKSTGSPGKGAAIGLAAVCWVLALLVLPAGLTGLMANFGG